MVLLSCIDEHEIPELDNSKTDPPENHQYNGANPLVNTHPFLPHSPLEDTSMASAMLPPRSRVEAGDAALKSQEGDLSDAFFLGANYMLYGAYQDLVQQNIGNQLDVGIAEDSKLQAWWEKRVCIPTQCYDAPSGKVRKIFVGILYVELDRVRDRKWNAERVIIFNPLSSNAHKAFTITRKFESSFFRLDLWNCG